MHHLAGDVESAEQQLGSSGAYERDEKSQYAVPMEAAAEHFHLMPSRPSVEEDEEEVRDPEPVLPRAICLLLQLLGMATHAAYRRRPVSLDRRLSLKL